MELTNSRYRKEFAHRLPQRNAPGQHTLRAPLHNERWEGGGDADGAEWMAAQGKRAGSEHDALDGVVCL